MAIINVADPFSGDLAKEIYAWCLRKTRLHRKRFDLLARGGMGKVPFITEQLPDSRGKRVIWNIMDEGPGTAEVPDITTRLFSAKQPEHYTGKFALTSWRLPFRVKLDEELVDAMKNDAGFMAKTTLNRLEGLVLKSAATIDSLLTYGACKGQVAKVSSTGGVTVTVGSNVEKTVGLTHVNKVYPGQAIEFRGTDGSAISNSVYGYVKPGSKSVKAGAGNVTVVFPTVGTEFAIPNSALVIVKGAIQGSTTKVLCEGMPTMISSSAYPTTGIGQNIQLDDAQFKSVEQAVAGKIQSFHLRSVLSRIKTTAALAKLNTDTMLQGNSHPYFDDQGYPVGQKMFWYGSQATKDKLELDFWRGGGNSALKPEVPVSRGFNEGEVVDEGRRYERYMGVPFIVDDGALDDELYLLTAESFCSDMLEVLAPYEHRGSGWNPINGSEEYEMLRQMRGLLTIINRDCNARIYQSSGDPLGYTPDEIAALAA